MALRRGARFLAPEDLLFLMRRDANRMQRMKEFLSWKSVRKNAKPGGSGNGSVAGAAAPVAAEAPPGDDAELVAELEEDAKHLGAAEGASPAHAPEHPGAPAPSARAVPPGPRPRQLGLAWDFECGLVGDVLGAAQMAAFEAAALQPRDGACGETARRLRLADLLTRAMSQGEYLDYAECRQASFTYKKARKFREWLVGGTPRPGAPCLAAMAGGAGRDLARLNDDVLEILGFLAYEMVHRLAECSLAVKFECEQLRAAPKGCSKGSRPPGPKGAASGMAGVFSSAGLGLGLGRQPGAPAPAPSFMSALEKTPILPAHMEEAYRRLTTATGPHSLFRAGPRPQHRRRLLF